MADVSSNFASWSATAASNSPSGATNIGTGLDDNLREIQAVIVAALAHKGSDLASASTVDVTNTDGHFHDVTGTTSITAFGTVRAGITKVLKFEGILTLTHNATSLIIPGAANITTAVGDMCQVTSEASGNWRVNWYVRANGNMIKQDVQGTDVASATTTNLDTATGDVVDVTGTTAITGITLAQGIERTVRFTGALTLTHGASLVLPGAANITTAAGDFAIFRGYAAGVVRCVAYIKASGLPVVNEIAAASQAQMEAAASNVVGVTPGRQHFHPAMVKALVVFDGTGTPSIKYSYNVTSITDNGTGDYTINLTNALADTNVGVQVTCSGVSGGTVPTGVVKSDSLPTASAIRIQCVQPGTGLIDPNWVTVTVYGDM